MEQAFKQVNNQKKGFWPKNDQMQFITWSTCLKNG